MVVKFGFGGLCTLFLVWYLGIHSVLVHRAHRRAEAEAEAAS
jgi:hypothetical protein